MGVSCVSIALIPSQLTFDPTARLIVVLIGWKMIKSRQSLVACTLAPLWHGILLNSKH